MSNWDDVMAKTKLPDEHQIKLTMGVNGYNLPKSLNGQYSIYLDGLLLLSKNEAEGYDEFWDYEIINHKIYFSPDFLKLLDYEYEEFVNVLYIRE